jgi:multidrug transporter EmrE-like cation transporter
MFLSSACRAIPRMRWLQLRTEKDVSRMRFLDHILAVPGTVFVLLLVAATLEVLGDAFLQSAVHRSSGLGRWIFLAAGGGTLSFYGLAVNLPQWDFGKLLGVYVVLFFVIAQIVAKLRFNQPTSPPLMVGGLMIVVGGLVISFWKG